MPRLLLFLVFFATTTALAQEERDLAAARAVFEGNIAAIRAKDRAKYLSYYLDNERLVRGGTTGITTGFVEFAAQAGANWPDTMDASDLQLAWIQPGVVYGTYRYRVRYGAEEHSGISERLFVRGPDGAWKIGITGAIDAPPGTPAPPRALVGGTLIDGRGGAPIPNATVVIRNGKIDCAGKCDVPEGVLVVDAKGMWITPGLIDTHVHFSQTGWADGRPDALDVRATHPYEKTIGELKAHPERFGRSHLCSGITSVFDVGGYPWTLQLADRFATRTDVPRVVAAGPLLSTLDHWLNLPGERQFIHLKDEATGKSGVSYLAAQGAKAVKVWYIVQKDLPIEKSFPAVAAAGEAARAAKIPLIVHATGLADAKAAVRAGAKLLVHNVDEEPIDQEFIDLLKSAGTIVTPTITVTRGYLAMYRGAVEKKAPAIDDPNGCVDKATRERVATTAAAPTQMTAERLPGVDAFLAARHKTSAENLMKLVRAGIPVATGTDAGNPLTLHGPSIYAEMEAMQAAGMSPMQVITASTATAARALGVEATTGTIEAGKDADLLVLTADPSANVANFRRIRSVVRVGVVRGIDELSAMAR